MARKNAKDQPPGFTNRIERVALVGAGGQLGKYIAAALLQNQPPHHHGPDARRQRQHKPAARGQHPALTRSTTTTNPTLVAALHNQQIPQSSPLSVSAAPDTHSKLVRAAAAAAAGVRYVMPNYYSSDLAHDELVARRGAGHRRRRPSCWAGSVCMGFDHEVKTMTLYDDGQTARVDVTTFEQCARAVVALVSLSELPVDEDDDEEGGPPTRVTGEREGAGEEEWMVAFEGSRERQQRGVEMMKSAADPFSARMGAALATFSRIFYPNGGGDYESTRGLANDLLGLPKEDLDERTRVAKQMMDDGPGGSAMGASENSEWWEGG
ncbi:hypothetical protein C8A00DRAFT_41564 [Chaetomidium leptoderma]|uniref:NmrA-like domain-containing protein n=1 Tax=Chaetomidium leptoderma TaxID=669021 RepID=A0AAN6VTE3_9PEZI|nr:hypothetical protein C8A00DRAFT_41564 [Chaetomidium leptoderma]